VERRTIALMTSQLFPGTEWYGTPGLIQAREIGYDAVELQLVDPAPDGAERREALETVADTGSTVACLSALAIGVADLRPQARQFHLEDVKRHIDFAAEIGAPRASICIGEYVWAGIVPKEAQWWVAAQSVHELGDYAQACGVSLSIELEALGTAIVHSVDDMLRFLAEVDHPNVDANLDISHMGLQHQGADDVERIAPRIGHVHFSDSNGSFHQHLPPGDGVMALDEFAAALATADYDGTVSVELGPLDDLGLALDWATRAHHATRLLLAQA
jgi:D-psicose/D-tagatose/L-ribulose 3-epimerase